MGENMGYIGTYITPLDVTINGIPHDEHCKRNEIAEALKQMAERKEL